MNDINAVSKKIYKLIKKNKLTIAESVSMLECIKVDIILNSGTVTINRIPGVVDKK